MKMYITTNDGSLIHTLKYIEEYDLDKPHAKLAIIDYVREAQKTAKWFASNPKFNKKLSEEEIKTLTEKEI